MHLTNGLCACAPAHPLVLGENGGEKRALAEHPVEQVELRLVAAAFDGVAGRRVRDQPDAYSDGTVVGREGPDCQFPACPVDPCAGKVLPAACPPVGLSVQVVVTGKAG